MTQNNTQQESTSGVMIKTKLSLQPIKPIKKNQILPLNIPLQDNPQNQYPQKATKKTIKTQRSCKNLQVIVSTPSNNFNNIVNHSPLEQTLTIKPNYSLGSFLRSIQFQDANQNNLYTCVKTGRFPYSRFKFTENKQNGRTFELVSNLWGTKYDLQSQGNNIFSIRFSVDCGISSPSRQFQIYTIQPGIDPKTLQNTNNQKQLAQLYLIGQNRSKMLKLNSLQPQMNEKKGYLALQLVKSQIVPSVQNCSIVDSQGTQVMQMYKIDQHNQVYEICFSKKIEPQWSYAFALASLDFKLALQ